MGHIGRAIRIFLLVKAFVFGGLVIALWIRSFGIADSLVLDMGDKSSSLTSASGVIIYCVQASGSDAAHLEATTRHFEKLDPDAVIKALPDGQDSISGLGFSHHRAPLTSDGHGVVFTFTFPHWILFLLGSMRAVTWSFRKLLSRNASTTKVAKVLGWCSHCQSQQYGQKSQCTRCGGPWAYA